MPRHRPEGDGQIRDAHRTQVQAVRIRREPERRARDHHHGLGGGGRPGDR